MMPRPLISTRTDTLLPYTTLFRCPMMSRLIRSMRRKIHTVPQAFISPRNLANMRGTILLTLWDRGLFLRPVAREFHATGLHLGHIGLQHLGAGQALGIEVLGPGQGGVGDRRRP